MSPGYLVEDVRLMIFRYLDFNDLRQYKAVCRTWRNEVLALPWSCLRRSIPTKYRSQLERGGTEDLDYNHILDFSRAAHAIRRIGRLLHEPTGNSPKNFSPSTRYIISEDRSGYGEFNIRSYDAAGLGPERKLRDVELNSAIVSPNDCFIACTEMSMIHIWTVQSLQKLVTMKVEDTGIALPKETRRVWSKDVSFITNDQLWIEYVIESVPGELSIWVSCFKLKGNLINQVRSLYIASAAPVPFEDCLSDCKVISSPCGMWLAATVGAKVKLWKVADIFETGGDNFHELHSDHPIRAISFSDDGTKLAAIDRNDNLIVLDTTQKTASVLHCSAPQSGLSRKLIFSPMNCLLLVTGGDTTETQLYKTEPGLELIQSIPGHGATFSIDGNFVLTIRMLDGDHGYVNIFEIVYRKGRQKLEETRTLQGQGGFFKGDYLNFSSDGQLLMKCGGDDFIGWSFKAEDESQSATLYSS